MIQGGDPTGNGTGDPGYAFKNETSPDLKFDRPGRLAYANAGPNTNGSQFFITEVPYPSLNDYGYTIFGQCDEATVALVKQIARMGRDSNDRPYRPVEITHITIVRSFPNDHQLRTADEDRDEDSQRERAHVTAVSIERKLDVYTQQLNNHLYAEAARSASDLVSSQTSEPRGNGGMSSILLRTQRGRRIYKTAWSLAGGKKGATSGKEI